MRDIMRGAVRGRGRPGDDDAGDFGGRVRRFALDARRVLDRPDTPPDEVMGLYLRASFLAREAPGGPSSEIHRWVQAVRRQLGARMRALSPEDLESWVV